MVAGPDAEHLTGSAGQVEHAVARSEPERSAEDRELVLAERVVDPMVLLPDLVGAEEGGRVHAPL